MAVAINFSASTGLILQVGLDVYWMYDQYLCPMRQALFDCGWLSDYCNEQETLFVGGHSKFAFQTIIHVSGEDYIKYVNGIRHIEAIMACNENVYFSMEHDVNETRQMLFRLLSHELNRYQPDSYPSLNGIPSYIENLLHNTCIFTETAFLCAGNGKTKTEKVFKKLFFDSANTWMDLRLLMSVFPSLKTIHFAINKDMGVDYFPDEQVFLSVLYYLQNNAMTKLEEVMISFPQNEQFKQQADAVVVKYLKLFAKFKWLILPSNGAIAMGSIHGDAITEIANKGTMNPLLLQLVQALK
eukprot:306348_1